MRPSEIKLLTEGLEARGYDIKPGKVWNGKPGYGVRYSNPSLPDASTYFAFAPSDHQSISDLIKDQEAAIESSKSEAEDYARKANNKIISRTDLNDLYLKREQTLDELWISVKIFYEQQIERHTNHLKLSEIVASHLKEIQKQQ